MTSPVLLSSGFDDNPVQKALDGAAGLRFGLGAQCRLTSTQFSLSSWPQGRLPNGRAPLVSPEVFFVFLE